MKISIEGVPGSGKTTILKILQKMGYNCYMEGEHHNIKTGTDTSVKLIESSPYVLKRLWTYLNSFKESIITSNLLSVNEQDSHILLSDWKPDYIIFLDCQPDICMKRLSDCKPEKNLSGLQITQLYQQFEWILQPVNCDILIYRINASGSVIQTLHTVLAVLNTIIKRSQQHTDKK